MELARQKEYQEKARNDIMNAVEKYGWTYDAFNNMKYLDKCVAEGARLHPAVSTIDRCSRNDYKVQFSSHTVDNQIFVDRLFRYPVPMSLLRKIHRFTSHFMDYIMTTNILCNQKFLIPNGTMITKKYPMPISPSE